MSNKQIFDSKTLAKFLEKNNVWFKLHEFEDDVKTSLKAAEKVPKEKIVKSLVLIDSNNEPLIVILQSFKKVDFKKIKKVLKIKDVRLANPEEVKKYSGYEVGAVSPVFHKNIKRILLDKEASSLDKVFAGGGEVNKLIEIKMEDIIKLDKPIIEEISE